MASKKRNSGQEPFNRTGVLTSQELARELVDDSAKVSPSQPGDGSGIHAVRTAYQDEGEPLGSLPETTPGTLGAGIGVLIDRMSERLVFERTGVRLYEALLQRCKNGSESSQLLVDDLEQIRREELEHFHMLVRSMRAIGADPTAMTPSADVTVMLSRGISEVIHDPRATLDQCLQALLAAELADGDGWMLLRDVAAACGRDDLADLFQDALEQEEEHLMKVRGWLSERTLLATPRLDEREED